LDGIAKFIRGIRESNYIEFKKLQSNCIEQESIRVTERFEARIEVASDLKMEPNLSKKFKTLKLASCTGSSTES
jgi:hypothetical protein